MDGNSLNITQDLLEKLKGLVPQAFSEDKLDIQKFQTLLGEDVNTDSERYQLSWAGKSEAYKVLQMPTTATLIPQPEQSVNWDESENIFIEGENLEVLKVLQKSYYGKIKMIYIDPPYNTGSDSFIYPDKFSETKEEYLKRIGEKDEEGYMMKEGLFRKNSKENGQFHSNWLNMMLPRLFLARNLLREEGVIFVSIDDNEQSNLRMLMDEVFGEENFVGQMIWAGGRKNDSKFISTSHEYILAYSKNIVAQKEKVGTWRVRKKGLDEIYGKYKSLKKAHGNDFKKIEAELKLWFSELPNSHPAKSHKHYSCIDKRGIFFPDNISWPGGGGPSYEVLHPVTKKPVIVPSRGWLYTDPKKMQEMIDDDRVYFGEDENSVPCLKSYLEDREYQVPYSVFYQDGRASTKRLRKLMGGDFFEHPKDEEILSELIEFCTGDNDIILDFFAGSGTSAHSVIQLNELDKKNRRFICVQLPEKTDENSEAFKNGFNSISEICENRIKKVIENIEKGRNGKITFEGLQKLGFRKYTLSPSNFKIWRGDVVENEAELAKQMELFVTPQRANAQTENILWELLIKNGVSLTEKIQHVEVGEGAGIYHTSDKRFTFVLDKFTAEVQVKVLALKPRTVICLDSLFQNHDMVKTNAQLKFEDDGITFRTV
jgi:adenine-specific DNA-methyltransferase